jgi:TM2 domain-containing membrane protein YozV
MTIAQPVNHAIGEPRKKSVAYALVFVGLTGVCGLQRFYAGKVGSGLLYLFTIGFLGVGQFIDLFLVPEMVDDYNRKKVFSLPGQYVAPPSQQQVVVNIGEHVSSAISGLSSVQPVKEVVPQTLEQKILQRCHDESASIGQICIAAGFDVKEVKEAVDRLTAEGLLHADIDEAGVIRFKLG